MENTNERLSELAFDLEAIKTLLDNAIFESDKDVADMMMIDAKTKIDEAIDELEAIIANL